MSKLQSIATRKAGRPQLMYGQSWFKARFDWLTNKQAANLSTHFSHRWERMTPDARKVILNTYWRSQPCLNELRSCSNALTKTIPGLAHSDPIKGEFTRENRREFA